MNNFSHQELTHLEANLKLRDSTLYGHYATVMNRTLDLMPRAYATFWSYTDHTLTHTHKVIEIIDRLCPEQLAETLTPSELFILLAGATLHDIGMVTPQPQVGEDADAARRGHDIVGAEMIRADPARFGIPPMYANAVATVVRHHRNSVISEEVKDLPVGLDMVRLRLLCSFVRAGDELHLTEDRAPDVVSETLSLPDESVRHFAACRAVTGIAPAKPGSADLVLNATVDDVLAEDGVLQIVEKVNAELEKLHSIFATYNVPAFQLRAVLQREGLILRKTLLHLCYHPAGKAISAIAAELGEDETEIRDALRSLLAKGIIRVGSATNEDASARKQEIVQVIAEDIVTIQDVSRYFLNGADDVAFTHSPYAREAVQAVVFPWLSLEYSCAYSPSEISLRISALQHSPAALAVALFSADVGRVPSLISRRVLLDIQLMHGVLSDIYRRPECFDGADVQRIASHVGRQIARRVSPFVQLISHAWGNRDKSLQEMWQMVSGDTGINEDSALGVSISLKFPAKPAFLSFPHLLEAAHAEEVPLEISAPHLNSVRSSFGMGERPAAAESNSPSVLTAVPSISSASSMTILPSGYVVSVADLPPHQMPVRLFVDEEASVCRWFASIERSFEDETLPWRAELSMGSDGQINDMQLRPSHHLTSCTDEFEYLKMRRLQSTSGRYVVEIVERDSHEVLASGQVVINGRPEPTPELYFNAIRILTKAETALGERIPPPFVFFEEMLEEINQNEDILTSGTSEQIKNCLESVALRYRGELEYLKIRVTVYDATGVVVSDCCPALESQLPSLRLADESGHDDPTANEKVRAGGMEAHYRSTHTPRELLDIYTDAITRGEFMAPDFSNLAQSALQRSEILSKSEVEFSISPLNV